MQLSTILDRFSEPETLKMAKLGRELRAKGIDVIDLSLGEPDFDTPQHIKDAAKKAIDDNWSHYTPVPGYLDLREAICTKFKRDNNLDYKPENIVTSTGAKQSLANAVLALVDESEEVIIPTPYWVTYSELVKIARGKVVEVHTSLESGFKITPAQLENAITPRRKCSCFLPPAIRRAQCIVRKNWKNWLRYSGNIPAFILFQTKFTSISILLESTRALHSFLI